MRILILGPHPFYIDRGSPIDLDLVVRVLSEREGTEIDMVVYGEGEDREYPRVRIHRARRRDDSRPPPPGFSAGKLPRDASMFLRAWSLVRRNRYDFVHAGEEAVFFAMFFRRFYGIPYAYDLDSSVAEQMTEQMSWLGFLQPVFDALERRAVRGAMITFPVCNSLAELCRQYGAARVVTLHDISQLENPDREPSGRLRKELGTDRLILLYVGNLAPYQGIDLLLDGFAIACGRTAAIDLVVIGGQKTEVRRYREMAEALGIADRCHLLGPRPFERLGDYLAEADILTAPRVQGRNTPMKVFPYLHSGRPVLVTDLPTHSQILTSEVARLAPPTPEGFAEAIVELAENRDERERLGRNGRAFVEAGHTFAAHRARLMEAYDWVEEQLAGKLGRPADGAGPAGRSGRP